MCEENCAPKCEDLNVDFGWLDPIESKLSKHWCNTFFIQHSFFVIPVPSCDHCYGLRDYLSFYLNAVLFAHMEY